MDYGGHFAVECRLPFLLGFILEWMPCHFKFTVNDEWRSHCKIDFWHTLLSIEFSICEDRQSKYETKNFEIM